MTLQKPVRHYLGTGSVLGPALVCRACSMFLLQKFCIYRPLGSSLTVELPISIFHVAFKENLTCLDVLLLQLFSGWY